MVKDESLDSIASEKLRLLESPLVSEDQEDIGTKPSLPGDTPAPDLRLFGDRFGANHDCPQFKKVGCAARFAYALSVLTKNSTRMPVCWSYSMISSSQPITPSSRRRRALIAGIDSGHMLDIFRAYPIVAG